MEYSKYIITLKPKLITLTTVNDTVWDFCVANRILNQDEKDELETTPQKIKRSSKFWDVVKTRPKCLSLLITIFQENNQGAVVEILEKAERDDGSDQKYNFIKNLKPLDVKVYKPKQKESHDDDEYELDQDIIGLALIINITKFEDSSSNRAGSENDAKYMKELWGQIGYKTIVHEGHFTEDRISEAVKQFLEKFKKMKTPMSCVVFVGTHGQEGKLFLSDGDFIRLYEDFIFKFTDSPILEDKPKIFILQACQGFSNSTKSSDFSNVKDTIVCYPTVPGDTANRDMWLGSWYIYTLTDVFMREAHRWEIRKMLKEVRRKMLLDIQSDEEPDQVSYYRAIKLKPLYFNIFEDD